MRAPSAITAVNATLGGQPHSTSIIDSRMPRSAHSDPTERSMPPVMMTMPTPMLKIPYVPTSRPTFCRLVTLKNCGLAMATMAHSTTSSRRVPISFRVTRRPTP
jgi:hypothetical protein